MKKIVTILAVAALAVTACTDKKDDHTGHDGHGDHAVVEASETEVAEAVEETIAETVEETVEEVVDTESTSEYADGTVEKSIFDFLSSGETGTKEFTLDALSGSDGGEGSELSEEAKLQLSHIADILAANPDLKAEIQAHGPDKVGIKPKTTIKANWVKAKMVLFKDFKGEQLTAKGHGSDHLLEGVDAKSDEQKRVIIALTK